MVTVQLPALYPDLQTGPMPIEFPCLSQALPEVNTHQSYEAET